MSPDEIRNVICSSPMQLSQEGIERGDLFPFKYLQRLGAGSRTLHVPVLSSSITWSERQVATLAKSSGMIYIMASSTLNVKYMAMSLKLKIAYLKLRFLELMIQK